MIPVNDYWFEPLEEGKKWLLGNYNLKHIHSVCADADWLKIMNI